MILWHSQKEKAQFSYLYCKRESIPTTIKNPHLYGLFCIPVQLKNCPVFFYFRCLQDVQEQETDEDPGSTSSGVSAQRDPRHEGDEEVDPDSPQYGHAYGIKSEETVFEEDEEVDHHDAVDTSGHPDGTASRIFPQRDEKRTSEY